MRIPTLSAPLWAGINITDKCNLKCRHCIYEAGEAIKNPKELKTEEIKNLIDQLSEMNVVTVEFLGGEPFCQDDLQELIDYARSKHLQVVINTNATLITREWLERNKDKIFLFKVSLDGHNHEVHDNFRGVLGSFEKTTTTIKNMVDLGLEVCLISTIHKKNYKNIKKIIELAKDLKVNTYTFTIFTPVGRGEKEKQLTLSVDEIKQCINDVILMRLDYEKSGIKLNIKEEIPQVITLKGNLMEKKLNMKTRVCTGGFTQMGISSSGYVYPCTSIPNLESDDNDSRKKSLKEIWINSDLFSKWRDRSNLTGKCSDCDYMQFCGGGCRYISYVLNGSINASDPYCWYESKVD